MSDGRGKWVRPLPAHGSLARYDHGCRCDPCGTARREWKRTAYERRGPDHTPMPPERAAKLAELLRQRQADSLTTATRAREPWTEDDLEIALDYQHTAAEAARLIGRSLSAVRNARARAKARPEMLPYRPRRKDG